MCLGQTFGGNRQNGQKNLVETGKTAKKIWWYYVFKVYSPLKLLIMEDGVIYFKRKIYDTMLKWKSERNGETALLIQGARRVGKSTIAEEFARHEYKSYILIDFSKVSKEVSDLFSDISDLNYLFIRLQFIYQVQLYERNSVIIFDEVQLQPLARQAIKHLVKDRRYDYIETGSLISVRSKSRNIIIPSEETKVDMYPMDYEEFRWALGDTTTIALLRAAFEKKIGTLSPSLPEKIYALVDDAGLDLYLQALDKAVKKGSPHFNYIEATAMGMKRDQEKGDRQNGTYRKTGADGRASPKEPPKLGNFL